VSLLLTTYDTSLQAPLQWREGKVESMGSPQVKFGDSLVLLQHFHTGKWLGMPVSDRCLCIVDTLIPDAALVEIVLTVHCIGTLENVCFI